MISWIIHAFWLVIADDLLEDRHKNEVTINSILLFIKQRESQIKSIVNTKWHLLDSEFILPQWLAVVELDGAPQTVKLSTLVNVHHSIGWWYLLPYFMNQELFYPFQHHFKDGKSTAKSFFRQHVAFFSVDYLLQREQPSLVNDTNMKVQFVTSHTMAQ